MQYCTEFEICALLFLIVVAVRFFGMRKFPSRLNHLFGIILCCAVADIALDILGSYTIEYADSIAPWINYAVNTVFYFLQVMFPALMLTYVVAMTGVYSEKRARFLYIPVFLFELMLLINPFTGIIFYLKYTAAGIVYSRGSLFKVLYLGSMFYMAYAVIFVIKFRRHIRPVEFGTIISFIGIVVVAMLLQYIFPSILLTGVAISLAILMMFFTLQNPESMLDMITGVFNYTAMNDYLRSRIDAKRSMWLLAVDVGGIRRINSSFGLRAGNMILKSVGTFLNAECSNKAVVFRMIGTRFLIISEKGEVHRRISAAVDERFHGPWNYGGIEMTLSATIRYTEEPSSFSAPEDVINLIDLSYSESSGEGFGTMRPIGSRMLDRSRRRMQVELAIRRALTTGVGFSLNYQPIYSVNDGAFRCAESLLRLNDPELGPVSPAEFIPVAESTGLIQQIDWLVLDMASTFAREHNELFDSGFERLEINLSSAEFYNDAGELADRILRKLSSIENRICFEVTETAATVHRDILSEFMERLIGSGVCFALDDFGTGYASITQLLSLPFSIVKLDRSFIVSERSRDLIILEDLIKMFDRTGLSVVVEGAETPEQTALAIRLGSTLIQGFYYSRPLPEAEFLDFMRQAKHARARCARLDSSNIKRTVINV